MASKTPFAKRLLLLVPLFRLLLPPFFSLPLLQPATAPILLFDIPLLLALVPN